MCLPNKNIFCFGKDNFLRNGNKEPLFIIVDDSEKRFFYDGMM